MKIYVLIDSQFINDYQEYFLFFKRKKKQILLIIWTNFTDNELLYSISSHIYT